MKLHMTNGWEEIVLKMLLISAQVLIQPQIKSRYKWKSLFDSGTTWSFATAQRQLELNIEIYFKSLLLKGISRRARDRTTSKLYDIISNFLIELYHISWPEFCVSSLNIGSIYVLSSFKWNSLFHDFWKKRNLDAAAFVIGLNWSSFCDHQHHSLNHGKSIRKRRKKNISNNIKKKI